MAVAIDGDLDLDVAVLVEPLLEVERVVAEGGLRLGAADPKCRLELARGADHAHALAAATGRRLDQDRVADPLGLAQGVKLVAEHPVRARDRRQAVGSQQLARPGLAAEPFEDRGRRPDEGQVVGGDDLREALVLRQEAVAGVDRVAARHERGGDDRRGRQVRALGVGRTDADRLVGELDGQGLAIGLAVGDDRLDAEDAAGPQDPERDLSAVGDEDLAEHDQRSVDGGRRRRRGDAAEPDRGRELDDDQALAVLDRVAGLDQVRADDAVAGRHDVLRDARACRPCRSDRLPGHASRRGRSSAAGRCRPRATSRPPGCRRAGRARGRHGRRVRSRPGPTARQADRHAPAGLRRGRHRARAARLARDRCSGGRASHPHRSGGGGGHEGRPGGPRARPSRSRQAWRSGPAAARRSTRRSPPDRHGDRYRDGLPREPRVASSQACPGRPSKVSPSRRRATVRGHVPARATPPPEPAARLVSSSEPRR